MGNFPHPEQYFLAAQELKAILSFCALCPRQCGVNRMRGETGYCGAEQAATVNISQLHFGEEPPISGSRGSGAVFFSGCTMSCLFCQNHQISRSHDNSSAMEAAQLAGVFMDLQARGAHNLNLVTPTPHIVVILEALGRARARGLVLPVVYNTSGFERVEILRRLRGLVEIYLPDYKYADSRNAEKLSDAGDYPQAVREALREMHDQVGDLSLDADGVALKGLLVRHLVLPQNYAGTHEALANLSRICGNKVWVSLMSQYTPLYKAGHIPGLNRTINREEYENACQCLEKYGLQNGFVQDLVSADKSQVPRFDSSITL
jgi:putative pyruvate formate lyase activating enzyme